MATTDTPRYRQVDSPHYSEAEISRDQQKGLLGELIASSSNLILRVWVDGIYTDIEGSGMREDWMTDREVYFKIEGKVEKLKAGAGQ